MDETAKISHICPQQINDETEYTDSTPHDILAVVGDEDNRKLLRIVQLDSEGGEVTPVGDIPCLDNPTVVVYCAGSIFCLGDYEYSGLVHEFDLAKRTVKKLTRWPKSARWSASAASSHEIIVSGGAVHSWQEVATCSVYTLATNRWMSLRQLIQARESHRMCWLPDGRVFAIGGCEREFLSSVEMLERAWIPAPRKEVSAEWKIVAPMKTRRCNFGCCVVEGRIVVAGGMTVGGKPSSSVESFEPPTARNTGQWTSLTDLASRVGRCFLIPSAAGLLLIDKNGEIQLGRRKEQVASSSKWTWEPRLRLTSFRLSWELVTLPSTAS